MDPDLLIRILFCIFYALLTKNAVGRDEMNRKIGYLLAGVAAGAVNGLLGAGGGMILVPLLTLLGHLEDRKVFPTSVAIIFPICLISLSVSPGFGNLPWQEAWPYLLAAIPGGLLAGILDKKIPVKWLHRALGILIIYGGVRYLW